MRQELEKELLVKLDPFLMPEKREDAKLCIVATLSKYDVRKEETEIVVYEGSINEQIIKRFVMAKIARGCSPRTVKYYKESVNCALEKIGKPYNEITADDIRAYLAFRVYHDGVSKTTANNERRNLSAFYFWLQKEEILLKNPMNRVEPIKVTKKKKKAFTQMEIEQMRASCGTSMEAALLEIMISTWARVSEIAQMKVNEIHGNSIVVHGKGDKDRTVYLSAKAQLALRTYLAERSDNNPYIFPRALYAGDVKGFQTEIKRKDLKNWYKDPSMVGNGHRDMGTLEQTIRKLGRKAGVANAHPHRFRRTGATMALRAGMPLINVSKLLGHENIGTTQIYLDISDKELEQEHEKYVV